MAPGSPLAYGATAPTLVAGVTLASPEEEDREDLARNKAARRKDALEAQRRMRRDAHLTP